MTVWKYPVADSISMPKGAKLLHVAAQGDVPHIWALVDPSRELEERRFMRVGTGWHFLNVGQYVGTYHLACGAFVFHVFEALGLAGSSFQPCKVEQFGHDDA